MLDSGRVVAAGKFLRIGTEKFWVKGVTYGTFRSEDEIGGYPLRGTIDADFAAMRKAGTNAVRTYTVPSRALLDAAWDHDLRVMVGIPWEQHIAFLDDSGRAEQIVRRVREGVRACAGHPAVLCYAIGNEIAASIVRWHGRRRIERFVRKLYDTAKAEDAGTLVTYVNFPTTEYLQLPFVDLVCFNVYLEAEAKLQAYLARLQNIAGERPLVLAEIGLDSRRSSEAQQASSLEWQLRSAYAAGCAGTFVFSWTDEWYRGGYDIDDWDFGLTTRDRRPKRALAAVQRAYERVPFGPDISWPRVSVVVCSYNGARTIRDALEGLKDLDYPDYEVLVVNDGSTDATPQIAAEYDVRLINTDNRGLSSARNTGWQAATGEIVAYIDDDAYPDPHWLKYLAYTFLTTEHVGVGGPNIAPPGDGDIADCIANAPGGPVHVLLSDTIAEHIPGCNMAYRRAALAAIDGFDVRYRAAGDDVDLCWRLMERGGTIGFHAGAMDWHHRRNSIVTYWKQQRGYGKAEALLEEKWPERYNAAGHLTWRGQLYGRGLTLPLPSGRSRVYGGVWGTAAYQSLYAAATTTLLAILLMPEWYLVIVTLGTLSLLALSWAPLVAFVPLFALAMAAPVAQAALAASRARFPAPAKSLRERARRWAVTFLLHMMQPLARLVGRLQHGLTPWRRRSFSQGRPNAFYRTVLWSERWHSVEEWLSAFERTLAGERAVVARGSDFDRWDFHIRGGLFGAVRVLFGIEEHGAGRQLLRVAVSAHVPLPWLATFGLLAMLALLAFADAAPVAGAVLTIGAMTAALGATRDSSAAMALARRALVAFSRDSGTMRRDA